MLSFRNLTGGVNAVSSPAPPCQFPALRSPFLHSTLPLRSLKLDVLSMEESVRPRAAVREVFTFTESDEVETAPGEGEEQPEAEEGEDDDDEKGIPKIRVARQTYIPVSKSELLEAIVLKLFDSPDDANQFLLLSSRLDSILHAEHKSILEEMRRDFFVNSVDNEEGSEKGLGNSDGKSQLNGDKSYFDNGSSNGTVWNGYSAKIERRSPDEESRLAVATRFQRAFMQLLNNAQFQELSVQDLTLTSALNSDYLLTLPVYVDWKKASESNAIIFRRGYSTERQKGLMIVEKLDYLQSRFLQKIFFLVSEPLGKVGKWMKEAVVNSYQKQEGQDWVKRMTLWLDELSLFLQSYSANNEEASDNLVGMEQLSDGDVPIWLAAQRAVSRYEGFLSPVGPRGRLLRKLFTSVGIVPPIPETPFEHDSDNNAAEPHLRPIFLSRISLSDIWRPATRKYCGNDPWKMLKTSFSILLSQSVLQEPAFEELILLYTSEVTKRDNEDKTEVPPLELKIYQRIPIPDLAVVFPHKKLSFRIIDTVRLDIATIVGLSAYFINYKFENIGSSPSAIYLDVIAITALIIYVTRVALGYKQTWDRYQLLVNRTLYEKTLASGFGSVHFLLDASEQQQYKEAILTYAVLLKAKNSQVTCHRSLGDECERFMYDTFKVKVEMPIDKAVNTLVRLGLVTETPVDGRIRLEAIPCEKADEALKARWNNLLG
ncbi:hypothetical protein M5689_004647 [Euphorbia peplus]|nr:hypothetical protein M5689_004647 [Euphorbia peplus]